ncbi:RsmE family RNA methyltransferase [Kosmotoga pacifica]|uniref:Ribosomal RNA small subunit methyltransferase E n=1 Tax=Kosmotoga pacifica TaxID=1330330 RepID=A0A0G2Z810_9BACT|nr:RsmE family RNA methyltransferase [Kosmotoga pacifica]AKI97697.1 hypothetical protein IX53_07575 [Kosmotoga pacifica]
MPHAFWIDSVENENKKVYLSPSEANHLKVMRVKLGEILTGLDGKGNIYRFQLETISKTGATGNLLSRKHEYHDGKSLIIFVASTKWPRIRLIIEKAVELGVDRIEIFNSRYSVAKILPNRLDKFYSVMREASKQCLNTYLPELCIIDSIDQIDHSNSLNLLLDFTGSPLQSLSDSIASSKNVRILVGPEGGFAENELKKLHQFCLPVSLGKRILRVETAVIVSASFASLQMGRL